MFFAIYDAVTGKIRKCLHGPSAKWAATNAEPGELIISSIAEIDDSRQAVDVLADPHVLIPRVHMPSQSELAIQVNRERARRLATGKLIDGVRIVGTVADTISLMNLAMVAQMRMVAGDGTPIVFRDGDNVNHNLLPDDVISIWQQSTAYVSALYVASWALKDMETVPMDIAADKWWPSA